MDNKNTLEEKIIKTFDIDDNFLKGAELAKNAVSSIGSPLNIGKFLLSVAINRDMPEAVELINWIKESKMDDDLKTYAKKGFDFIGSLPSEEVSITSLDGYKLKGHIVRAENQKRVIVAMHGWRSNWKIDFGVISEYWYRTGCTVLYAEQRAQGESEGSYMSFGVYERFDCYDWVKWACEYFGSEIPVFIAGVSMGAATVMMAAAEEYPENVRGIVSDCGFTSPEEIWKHVTNEYLHVPYTPGMLRKLCQETLHFNPALHTTQRALEKASLPLLFIHGEDDHFVPMEMTLFNYDACSSKKEIMLVPGADHGLSYYKDTKRYEETMTRFFNQNE